MRNTIKLIGNAYTEQRRWRKKKFHLWEYEITVNTETLFYKSLLKLLKKY